MSTEKHHITTTERAADSFVDTLRAWFAAKVGTAEAVEITVTEHPDASGFSSASVLFDAVWNDGGARRTGSFVARMAPETTAMAVFSRYDMAGQFALLRAVSEHSEVPVPALHWMEPDASVLGAPFFVMERAHGLVPPDNLPYVFDGWLLDATPEERQRLQHGSIGILARIHGILEPESRFAPLCSTTTLRQHVNAQRAYYRWALADDGIGIPLIERAFDWLEQHWPADAGPTVLSWGDARIGNIMYQDFEPVAVFDWEMAAVGPRELDLGWFIFFHRFFQDLTPLAGVPGLPDFLRRADVVDTYQAMSGYTVRDLDFYLVYAALRHAIIMARIKRRMIHFGEDTTPADADNFILHRAMLESLLAGTYTWE